MKPFRTFGVLERYKSEDFDLVKVQVFENVYRWELQLGGVAFYKLPTGLVQATADFTEEEVALMFFDTILDYAQSRSCLAYNAGQEKIKSSLRSLIGAVGVVTKGN